ncbi:hypothetical protein V4D00_06660, partial [Ralstonia solanacearum]|uniref:hypothetical protein n=1 Tax=Ralstonia solanacearum TaxID=305 RepID=UPI002F94D8C0
ESKREVAPAYKPWPSSIHLPAPAIGGGLVYKAMGSRAMLESKNLRSQAKFAELTNLPAPLFIYSTAATGIEFSDIPLR